MSAVQPRPHQRAAVDALVDAFSRTDRAQLHLPCGTGKTLVGLWTAQRLSAQTVAVFVPSIALAAQTVSAWASAGVTELRTLVVCSDPTSTTHVQEVGDDGIDPFLGDPAWQGRVTTDATAVARFLTAAAGRAELSVVVSTYHSSPVVAQALLMADVASIDLAIADEAHHLAGSPDERFATVLDRRRLPVRYRLFQTATPRVYADAWSGSADLDVWGAGPDRLVSMDDIASFGPVAYTMSTRTAIDDGLLAPYRVVIGQAGHITRASTAQALKPAGVLEALLSSIDQFECRRILTFHSRVADAHAFAESVNSVAPANGRQQIRGYAVDGSMSSAARQEVLAHLDDENAVTVVSSARCLGEGVDLPAVDAVVFAAPRTSTISIVQAVGRVLRTAPGKDLGTVIIPVLVPADGDDQDEVAATAYRHVWRVLRAMRAHDEQLATDLDAARLRHAVASATNTRDDAVMPDWLHILAADSSRPQIATRLLSRTSSQWEHNYGLLQRLVAERGSAAHLTVTTTLAGVALGQWVMQQRIYHADHVLDPERARRLESVRGWRWSSAAAADLRTADALDELLAGRSIDTLPEGLRAHRDGLNRPLHLWVAGQIRRYARGDVDPELVSRLEQLPGWRWQPYPDADAQMVQAFVEFVEWEHHTDVPIDYVTECRLRLGAWLTYQRRRKATRSIDPFVEAALEEASPTGIKGEREFAWKHFETLWGLNFLLCQRFAETHTSLAAMPVAHTEQFAGTDLCCYTWLTRQRYLHKRGDLSEEQAAALCALPGFLRTDDREEPPVDRVAEHGTWKGFSQGCRCNQCLPAGRRGHRDYKRAAAEEARAAVGWVNCHDVVDHLEEIEQQAHARDVRDRVTPGAIGAAARMSRTVVGSIRAGRATQCLPRHRAALLAITLDDVLAVWNVAGSRGRRTIGGRSGRSVDAKPLLRKVKKLRAAGWSDILISAAMGYSRHGLPFTAESANDLHLEALDAVLEEYGPDLVPPVEPGNSSRSTFSTTASPPAAPAAALRFAENLVAQGYNMQQAARLAEIDSRALQLLLEADPPAA